MSSRLKINLGLIQLAFGVLLLGDSFWSAGAAADWKSEWEKTVAAAKKRGTSRPFNETLRRGFC